MIQGLFSRAPQAAFGKKGDSLHPRAGRPVARVHPSEVMVATAIMGLVLVVLLQVFSGAMIAQETAMGHARALQAADRVLQDSCNALDLSSRQYSGQDGPYSYQVKISPNTK